MIISEHWLRDWVDVDLDTDGLVDCLTMAGLEVDSVTPAGPALNQVIVGSIVAADPHPQADRLRVCRVDMGGAQALEIVCGAPNARPGLLAPVALVGAELPSGMVIKQSTIRGVESNGMLCSPVELGLGEDGDGLLELDPDARPGQSLYDHLVLGDQIIEIDLTPNRGDCMSILGVARELTVLTGARLKQCDVPGWPKECDATIPISLHSPAACPRYVGRVIEGIDAGARTPMWLSERLRRCGVRPISAVVDVTNYVMLEIGQPMHAFDHARLHKEIIVRQARPGETLTLLDGSSQTLVDHTLVIADAEQAIAMAGVMGGSDSAISDHTTSIVLESAHFSPHTLAGQARHYALHTDASHRFERGVDPQLPFVASHYATALLRDITGGIPGPVVEAVDRKHLPPRPAVKVRHQRINKLIGMDIPSAKIGAILSRISRRVARSGDGWRVTPPSYRFDIARECDLIEEIARVSGYDTLPTRYPQMLVAGLKAPETTLDPLRLKQTLMDRGYREVVTYSFVDPVVQRRLCPEDPGIDLRNPLAPGLSVMRVSLWPGLLQALETNLNRQHRRLRLFEIGKTFHQNGADIIEVERLSGVVSGDRWPEQWAQPGQPVDFYDIKSDVEALLALTASEQKFSFNAADYPSLHPGQAAEIRLAERTIGWLGQLHPEHQRAFEIVQPVYLFELEVEILTRHAMPAYRAISRFPAIRRDLAVLVDEEVSARDLLESIRSIGGKYLTNLELFDVYRREDVDSKRKSLAFTLTLQASSRTLIDSEVESMINLILDELRSRFGAELRT